MAETTLLSTIYVCYPPWVVRSPVLVLAPSLGPPVRVLDRRNQRRSVLVSVDAPVTVSPLSEMPVQPNGRSDLLVKWPRLASPSLLFLF